MPSYSEGHKAREITLAEAAIVKLQDAQVKARDKHEADYLKAKILIGRGHQLKAKADEALARGDHDRKIQAAEAHLAWLRAMPVPEAVTPNGVAD